MLPYILSQLRLAWPPFGLGLTVPAIGGPPGAPAVPTSTPPTLGTPPLGSGTPTTSENNSTASLNSSLAVWFMLAATLNLRNAASCIIAAAC